MNLLGNVVEIKDSTITVKECNEVSNLCNGNACADIDYQFDEDTKSYHFYNDGNRLVILKVQSGTLFGCGQFKTRRMRPGSEWDTGFFGICKYEANYK